MTAPMYYRSLFKLIAKNYGLGNIVLIVES